MSFLQKLFGKGERAEPIALIDFGVDSVGGAYALSAPGESPILLYARRLPVEARRGEPLERAALRALTVLLDALLREGAPSLVRAVGSGSVSEILVSFDSPWQKTATRVEHLEQDEPFVFTHALADALLEKTRDKALAGPFVEERVVSVALNGYETREPYGKRARRATVVALSSEINAPVAEEVVSALRGAYHTKRVTPVAAAAMRYEAARRAFPHERDALIIDAMGRAPSAAIVRRDTLATFAEAASVARGGSAYARRVGEALAALAAQYPLPRMIFLLAREPDAEALRVELDPANLGKLWLSNDPPKLVSVGSGALGALVRHASASAPDLMLALMVLSLHGQHRVSENIA